MHAHKGSRSAGASFGRFPTNSLKTSLSIPFINFAAIALRTLWISQGSCSRSQPGCLWQTKLLWLHTLYRHLSLWTFWRRSDCVIISGQPYAMQDITRLSNADWKPSSSSFICDDAHWTSMFSSNENFSVFNWYCVPRTPKFWDEPSYIPCSTFRTGIVIGGEWRPCGLKNMVRYELSNAFPRGGISAPGRALGPGYTGSLRQED